jgi:hypothetical protein
MIDETNGAQHNRSRAMVPWLLVTALAMLVVGMLASPWFEQNVRARLPGVLQRPDVGAVSAKVEQLAGALAALDTRVTALEARPGETAPAAATIPALNDPTAVAATAPTAATTVAAALETRVEALERASARDATRLDNLSAELASLNVRLGALGASASNSIAAAADSAEKARGVLLVAAVRRTVDEGQSLAVLEPALRRYFGGDNAQAVERLLTASRTAPTLDTLRRRFAQLRPRLLADEPSGDGWWDRFVAGIADVVTVRRSIGDANSRRVADMAARLDRGDVVGALVLLQRMPIASQRAARDWRIDADAYASVRDALQQLEAAVLLDDADLRVTPPAPAAPETAL